MKVLLVNPPYQTLTSNWGVGHQVPLGLLMVGGPLLDAGHQVRLLDAECHRLKTRAIVSAVQQFGADVVMTGHAGSTPAHPVCVDMLRSIKASAPHIVNVYGGVYPTYHAERILSEEPAVDIIVRGEGEATAVELIDALAAEPNRRRDADGGAIAGIVEVPGLACRAGGQVVLTPNRPVPPI